MSVVSKDLWTTVKELFLEQYRGDLRSIIESQTYEDRYDGTTKNCVLPEGSDNRIQGVMKLLVDKLLQPLDDATVSLQDILDIDAASGMQLDLIGSIAGVKRSYEEGDSAYRDRIKNEVVLNKGIPDAVIYSAALLSQDTAPQYMDEAPATFMVYDGPLYERHEPQGEDPYDELVKPAGRQLSRAQVRKLAPAGVLGLPGAAIQFADGTLLSDTGGRLVLAVADDDNIEREVLRADNNGNIVVTPQSVPVRVVLRGPSVPSIPTITTEWNGVPADAVRIKDLPDGADTNGYMVRDSDTEGTVKSRAMDEATLDELWDSTPAEGEV
jgi:hypothetical protein